MKNPAPGSDTASDSVSALDHPRLTCRVVRGSLALFGDTTGETPRGPGAGHVAGCADCQAYFGACDALTLALKRDAGRDWHEAPGGLEQSILRAVQHAAAERAHAGSPRSRARPTSRGAWFSFAGVAACAAIAVFVFRGQVFPPAGVAPANSNISGTASDVPSAAIGEDVSPQQLWASVKPTADAVLAGDPLQSEVDALTADARNALGFLARNFLPTAPESIRRTE